MAEASGKIPVQVCYATSERQLLLDLEVAAGSSLRQVIIASGILQQVPEIDLARARVGIYGKLKALETVAHERDRIEIYRPLIADPKEARRRRAGRESGGKNS